MSHLPGGCSNKGSIMKFARGSALAFLVTDLDGLLVLFTEENYSLAIVNRLESRIPSPFL